MKTLSTSFAAAFAAAWLSALHAQTTPPDSAAREEPAVLSPFEVRTDRDVGYVATSSLAGGRTEMSLKQTAAAISVFTREFLDDIAADSLVGVAEWGLNMIPKADGNTSLQGEYNVNFRGLGNSFPSRNYFVWYVDSDSYVTERYEFARGPNSVLFGDGNVGGIQTTWTKRPTAAAWKCGRIRGVAGGARLTSTSAPARRWRCVSPVSTRTTKAGATGRSTSGAAPL
jgi:outer membrane receptor protein involved in Fe transport